MVHFRAMDFSLIANQHINIDNSLINNIKMTMHYVCRLKTHYLYLLLNEIGL